MTNCFKLAWFILEGEKVPSNELWLTFKESCQLWCIPLSYKDKEKYKDKDKDEDKDKNEDDNGADNYDAPPLSAFARKKILCKFTNHKSDDNKDYDDRDEVENYGMLMKMWCH